MASRLCDIIPDAEDLLRLEPQELGAAILETLHPAKETAGRLPILVGYTSALFELHDEQYPRDRKYEIEQAVSEAWCWLENEGFLAPAPDFDGRNGYRFVTRKGHAYNTAERVAAYRKAKALPWALIHSSIRDKVWSTFLRGDHDTAVFQAFKEVEIAVRSACGWGSQKIGVNLMRDAFKPQEGPLANASRPEAERIAERDLFAGAIGSYKNPQSHRHVGIPSAEEAAEMIILASHLLCIVGARAPAAVTVADEMS